MRPVYNFKVGHDISPRLVTVGRFSGAGYCLAFSSGNDSIMIHNTTEGSLDGRSEVQNLSINQMITCIGSGNFHPDVQGSRDSLLVGTQSTIRAYDVDENKDLVYKELPDGVNRLAFGALPNSNGVPVVVAGGNCSIQGINSSGEEAFWTVCGDDVTALSISSAEEKSPGVPNTAGGQMAVGTANFEIRVYRGDETVVEVSESDVVTDVLFLGQRLFAFGLSNGTIGVYDGTRKVWSSKSKSTLTALTSTYLLSYFIYLLRYFTSTCIHLTF